MKRSILAVVVLAAAMPAVAAPRPLRVGLMPALNSAPLVVAEQADLFDREGVVVELELFSSQLNRAPRYSRIQEDAQDG